MFSRLNLTFERIPLLWICIISRGSHPVLDPKANGAVRWNEWAKGGIVAASVWDQDQIIGIKVRTTQVNEESTVLRAAQKHWVVQLAAAHTPIPPEKPRIYPGHWVHLTLRLHYFGKHFNKASRKDQRDLCGIFQLPLPFQADNRSVLSCFAQHLVPLLVMPPDNVPRKGKGKVKPNC